MANLAYELAGPFSTSLKASECDRVISHAVKLRAERNTPHPLNPVGQLRRVVSSHYVVQDAVLLLNLQFFEIFTVVHEHQESVPQRRGKQIKDRILSVATGHLPSIPKRLRRGESIPEEVDEEPAGGDLQRLRSNLSDADYNNVEGILKDHVFSCGVAYAQIVKIKSSGESLTVFYHPNSMKATKLSKHHLAQALRFTLCLDSVEETTSLLKDLERRMSRYSQAALFLGDEYVLPSAMHIVAVTRPMPGAEAEEQKAELLLEKDPPWGTTIAAPSSWGPKAQGSSTPLWAFLMTPLGYGKCEISPQTVSLYMKGSEASFYVGVRHPQVSGAALATTSTLRQIRPGTETGSDEADSIDGDESEDEWQPDADEDTSSGGAGSSTRAQSFASTGVSSLQRGSTTGSSSASTRSPAALSKGRASSTQGVSGRHVRVHCHAKFLGTAAARQQTKGPAISSGFSSLPSSLSMSEKQAAAAVILLGCTLWWFFSWSLALTALNIGVALLYARPQTRQGTSGRRPEIIEAVSAEQAHGGWHVKLLRAEIVTDETWSAAGESILAEITRDDGEDGSQACHQRLAQEYGFSDDTVQRYLLAFGGDEVIAHRKMRATHDWRVANDAIDILQQPQPNFRFFKDMFRHGLLGTTKDGHPIWFMKVGDMKQGYKTFHASNLTSRDLARHVALCMEYMYAEVESKSLPNGRALWVLDLKGMGMTDLGSDAFELGKEIAGLISAHWPERLYRAFIINMPGFFSILWKLIEPMLATTTRRKIRLLRGKHDMLREMTEEMSEEDIPAEYGGKLEGDFYSSRKEKEFWKYVEGLKGKGTGKGS